MIAAFSSFNQKVREIKRNFNRSIALCTGCADAMINTSAYSFAAQAYPEDIDKAVATMETAIGIGGAIGPMLGSIVYGWLGFSWTFLVFGAAMIPSVILLNFISSPRDVMMNEEPPVDDGSQSARSARSFRESVHLSARGMKREQLGYGKLACQPRVIFAALAATVSYIAYCALDPTLVLRLADYGLDQSQKGLVFTIMPTMYMVSTIATPFLLPRWMEVRVWLMIMAFFLGVSMLFVGPICTDQSLVTMCIGLFSTGCLLGPLIIPNMQEMIDAAQ